jgi:hypothetical protein
MVPGCGGSSDFALLWDAYLRASGFGWQTPAGLEPKQLLAGGHQSLSFLAQDFPCFLATDLAFAESLDHIPDLGAVLVRPFRIIVRRAGKGQTGLHELKMCRLEILQNILYIEAKSITSIKIYSAAPFF